MKIVIEVHITAAGGDDCTAEGTWALEGDDAHCYQWLAIAAIEGELSNAEIDSRVVDLFRENGHAVGDNTTSGTWIAR